MTANPYQAPSPYASYSPQPGMPAPGGPNGEVPSSILESLRATKPWVRFLAVLGFIVAGLMILGGLGFALSGSYGGKNFPSALGWVYMVVGAIYLAPALYLNGYASSIGALLGDRSMASLDRALVQQKSFWRFAGWMTAIMLGLYFVMLVILVAVGVSGFSR